MNKLKIGIICEGKTPPDSRVPLTPKQCRFLLDTYGNKLDLVVQKSSTRCFTNNEYSTQQITLVDEVADCDILMGVKEVPIQQLIAFKKYLFFSHTIKEQPHNKKLIQTLLAKHIQMVDYECLTYPNGKRILGFGHFAGVVGAHNGLLAYGKRTGAFELKPAYLCKDFDEIKQAYAKLQMPAIKIVLTGNGRVSMGAKEVLDVLGIKEVSPSDYLSQTYPYAVYTQLVSEHLYRHKQTNTYNRNDFHQHPENYNCIFEPYTHITDLMMNGVYWAANAPVFFTKAQMREPNFKIKTIADISCDVEGSIPATLRSTHIGNAVMGYNPITEQEAQPYQQHIIDIMAVDNLPNELPRDASEQFGTALIAHVIPELLKPNSDIIDRASITQNGALHGKFIYLQNYAHQLA